MSIGQIFLRNLAFWTRSSAKKKKLFLFLTKFIRISRWIKQDEWAIVRHITVKTHHVNRSDFFKKLGFLDKIFSKKKKIIFISYKVYKDLKVNKARWTSLMTKKALDTNELLCDNNTVKTHRVNRSDLKKKDLAL